MFTIQLIPLDKKLFVKCDSIPTQLLLNLLGGNCRCAIIGLIYTTQKVFKMEDSSLEEINISEGGIDTSQQSADNNSKPASPPERVCSSLNTCSSWVQTSPTSGQYDIKP